VRTGFVFAAIVIAALAPTIASGSSQGVRSWTLGGGFVARVYVPQLEPTSPQARRTLIIRKGDSTIRRFSRQGEGLGVQVADITGDGVKDVLVLDYRGGSAGCGIYRLFAGPGFDERWVRRACLDWGIARLAGRALVAWSALFSSQTAATKGDIHCCWRKWRRTEWRWRSDKLVKARSTVGPPPSESWRVRLLPGTFPD
jgi:hypothetical protein